MRLIFTVFLEPSTPSSRSFVPAKVLHYVPERKCLKDRQNYLNEKGPDNLFSDCLVGEDTTVRAVNLLLTPRQQWYKCKGVIRTNDSPSYLLRRLFSWFVAGFTPFSFSPVMGHLGTLGLFLRYWNTSLPTQERPNC